jgi:hypothetical protein
MSVGYMSFFKPNRKNVFFGPMVIFGMLTGNEWWLIITDFSWDKINTWDELMSNQD